jgi:hypothetical protein
MPGDPLATYLNDHLAGATAATKRMERLAEAERQSIDGTELSRIAGEIAEDTRTLLEIFEVLNIRVQSFKRVAATVVEWIGLLKSNGTISRRSPMTTVVELEALRMGVIGKQAMWAALHETSLSTSFDFDELLQRAQRQHESITEIHRRRTHELFPRLALDAAAPAATNRAP